MRYWLAIVCLVFAGCAVRRVISPRATATAGATTVTQQGDAQVPATARTDTARRTVPLPSGSEIVFDDKLDTITLRLSAATTLVSEARTEQAVAPTSFTPPASPTPSEEADGRMTVVYRIALFAGLAIGLFGLVRGWDFVMYGGGCVAGAAAAALFVQRHPLLLALAGVGVALAIAGPWLWHTKLKRIPAS